MSRIAFIGLGNMGGPMAHNMLKAGHSLSVFDLSPAAIKTLADAGAGVAASAKEAVGDADIVISMLPASRHVEALYLGEAGILAYIQPGTLIIECSTIAAQSAITVAKAATARGLAMLDAPVSGGTGDAEVLERARLVLAAMGKNIFHAGALGFSSIVQLLQKTPKTTNKEEL